MQSDCSELWWQPARQAARPRVSTGRSVCGRLVWQRAYDRKIGNESLHTYAVSTGAYQDAAPNLQQLLNSWHGDRSHWMQPQERMRQLPSS